MIKNCIACHSFELPIKNKVGPSLAKVMNRTVGSLEDYKYSKSFLNIEKFGLIKIYIYFWKNLRNGHLGPKCLTEEL